MFSSQVEETVRKSDKQGSDSGFRKLKQMKKQISLVKFKIIITNIFSHKNQISDIV